MLNKTKIYWHQPICNNKWILSISLDIEFLTKTSNKCLAYFYAEVRQSRRFINQIAIRAHWVISSVNLFSEKTPTTCNPCNDWDSLRLKIIALFYFCRNHLQEILLMISFHLRSAKREIIKQINRPLVEIPLSPFFSSKNLTRDAEDATIKKKRKGVETSVELDSWLRTREAGSHHNNQQTISHRRVRAERTWPGLTHARASSRVRAHVSRRVTTTGGSNSRRSRYIAGRVTSSVVLARWCHKCVSLSLYHRLS